jgi:hypothetical protein
MRGTTFCDSSLCASIAAQDMEKNSHYGPKRRKKNSIMLAVEALWVTLRVVDARAS